MDFETFNSYLQTRIVSRTISRIAEQKLNAGSVVHT